MGKKTLTAAETRLNQVAEARAMVLGLRSQVTSAKEHVKELNAELKQALEDLLVVSEKPSLPFGN